MVTMFLVIAPVTTTPPVKLLVVAMSLVIVPIIPHPLDAF